MNVDAIARKNLDNAEFVQLRRATDKLASFLNKRLSGHLEVLKSLFIARALLGSYVKSASMEDVPVSDKAFADLQERYAAVCEKPFGLPRKLQTPLAPIATQLDASPFQYSLAIPGEAKPIVVSSPTRWVLSYRGECPLSRLRSMVAGTETRVPDEMRQGLVNHIAPVVFLKYFPAVGQLLSDLRYRVEVETLPDLGGLPVVIITAPLSTFLPANDFILQVTQLSGIAAFQEIIDREAIDRIPDLLKDSLRDLLS